MEIEKCFTYIPPKGNQPQRYERLRDSAKETAIMIQELVPDSSEKSYALAKLREAVMWANAAIACNE